MKKEKILKTQTKRQVAFVQSSLTSKNYSLHRETSFKFFALHPFYIQNETSKKRKGRATFVKKVQKQSGTSSKIATSKMKK